MALSWEKRHESDYNGHNTGGASGPVVVVNDFLLLESDAGAGTDLLLLESDAGAGTDALLLQSSTP